MRRVNENPIDEEKDWMDRSCQQHQRRSVEKQICKEGEKQSSWPRIVFVEGQLGQISRVI